MPRHEVNIKNRSVKPSLARWYEVPGGEGGSVGAVFVMDLPRPRGGPPPKVKPYDNVMLRAYPAGSYTYTSVGDIQRKVRRFSVGLETAIKLITDH